VSCPAFPFSQIATGNLDLPIIGQLAATNFSRGDEFALGPVKMKGFKVAFKRGSL
jgi:hypothetical protein